ncbi:MAG: zinc ribbon domain-containing protein [Desulfobulbaceae bacterium]|nr:zinc ribbon domain-containing protein [Desulfobulbaceae bacterium]
MPIYEYKCNSCDHIFEILTTSSKADENVQCSKCKSEKVNKIMSAGSFRLNSGSSLPSAPSAPSLGCAGKSGFS